MVNIIIWSKRYYRTSEFLHKSKIFGIFDALNDSIPIFDVFFIILYPGIEDVTQTMLSEILDWKDSKDLSIFILFFKPHWSELRNSV